MISNSMSKSSKAVEYLCSNTLISSISPNTNPQPSYKKYEVDSKPQYSSGA